MSGKMRFAGAGGASEPQSASITSSRQYAAKDLESALVLASAKRVFINFE